MLTVTDNPLICRDLALDHGRHQAGDFVGSAGMMQADGTQKAIEVHIFPESMRGTGEGHYDWDLKPKSKMTMPMSSRPLPGVDGQILSVKYRTARRNCW